MGFWSNLENEFKEHFGEVKNDEKEPDEEFDELLGDIKSDLKKIPKGSVIPTYSSHLKDKERYEEEKKRFEEEQKSKRKQCTIGDKTYDVGERWTDPETGKEMICILMNVPEEIQPILKKANIPLTKSKPPPVKVKKSKIPSKAAQQWSYTNKQKPKKKCDEQNNSDGEEEEDVSAGENDDDAIAEDQDDEDGELNEDEKTEAGEELEEDDVQERENVEEQEDGEEEDEEEEAEEVEEGDQPKEPEVIVVDPESNKEEGAVSAIESDSDSIEYESQNTPKRKPENQKEEEEIEPDEEGEKIDNMPQSEEEEDAMKHVIGTEKVSALDSQTLGDHKRHGDSEKIIEADAKEIEDPCEAETPQKEEQKGEPIFTRETVVVQRKLFKTEETIETTETEKYPEK